MSDTLRFYRQIKSCWKILYEMVLYVENEGVIILIFGREAALLNYF